MQVQAHSVIHVNKSFNFMRFACIRVFIIKMLLFDTSVLIM